MSKLRYGDICIIAFAIIAVLILASMLNIIPRTDAQAVTAEDVSPDFELLDNELSETDWVYYVDRKTNIVYMARYEGDVEGLAVAFNESGSIMTLSDYYAEN